MFHRFRNAPRCLCVYVCACFLFVCFFAVSEISSPCAWRIILPQSNICLHMWKLPADPQQDSEQLYSQWGVMDFFQNRVSLFCYMHFRSVQKVDVHALNQWPLPCEGGAWVILSLPLEGWIPPCFSATSGDVFTSLVSCYALIWFFFSLFSVQINFSNNMIRRSNHKFIVWCMKCLWGSDFVFLF